MSQDPKKPSGNPPGQTPDLLKQELRIDRRAERRVPTFAELQAKQQRIPQDFRPTAEQPLPDLETTAPYPSAIAQRLAAQAPPGLKPAARVAAPTQAPPARYDAGPEPKTVPLGRVPDAVLRAPPPPARPPATAAPPLRDAPTRPSQPGLPRAPAPALGDAPLPPTAVLPGSASIHDQPEPTTDHARPAVPPGTLPPHASFGARAHAPASGNNPTLVPLGGQQPPTAELTLPPSVLPTREAPAHPGTLEIPPHAPITHAPNVPAHMPQLTAAAPSLGASVPPGQQTPPRPAPMHNIPRGTVPARPGAIVPGSLLMDEATISHVGPPDEPTTLPGERPPEVPPPARLSPSAMSLRNLPQALPPELLSTQPGVPGPFAKPQNVPVVADFTAEADDLPPAEAHPSLENYAALLDPDRAEATRGDVIASPASLWRRVLAVVVDGAVLGGLTFGVLSGFALAAGKGPVLEALPHMMAPAAGVTAALATLYTTLFARLWRGRTPGRLVARIHLVDRSGRPPGVIRALFRGILSLFSFAFFLTGFWLALFDRRGQTLHDKLSRTFVVRLDASAS